jgi:sulfate adenylyltransferase subunit 1
MAYLEAVNLGTQDLEAPFRFPVQLVCRPRTEELLDYRGYQGRIESGSVAPGDAVTILPSGVRTRVKRVEFFGRDLDLAIVGQSVTLHLEDEVDVSRGDLIAGSAGTPIPIRDLNATLCWFSERPLDPMSRLGLRHGTREVRAKVTEILGRLDLQTLESVPAQELRMNDIATVSLRLQQPIAADPHDWVRSGGNFILIDEATNATVAAGLVLAQESY